MNTKFAGSNHAAAYEVSTLAQFRQRTGIAVFGERSIGKYLAFRHKRRRTGSNNLLAELENVQQNVEFRKSSPANESASPNGRGASRYVSAIKNRQAEGVHGD
jgi:hypothetical protein